jgi:cyclohexyl-isocyanide hydratase
MELVRHYRGDFYAKGVQLLGQYDPKPPFPGGGDPESADFAVVAMLKQMHAPFLEQSEQVIRAALAKG